MTPYYGTGFILGSMQKECIMDGLTIGGVAKRAGVGVETIRFYERKGLLEEPPRRESGYRQYPEEAIARIRFIRRAKDLGFSPGRSKSSSTSESTRQAALPKLDRGPRPRSPRSRSRLPTLSG